MEATAARLLAEHEPPADPALTGRAAHPPMIDGRYTLAGIAASTGYTWGHLSKTLRQASLKPTKVKAPGVRTLVATYDPAQVRKLLKARGVEFQA